MRVLLAAAKFLVLADALAGSLAVDPAKLSKGEAAALLAKLEFFTKGCGGKLTGDALEGVLARVLRDNALDIKAYEYNVLERAKEQHGASVFCAALGKSLGALP